MEFVLSSPLELAVKYVVDDLPGASMPCTRLQNVLAACSNSRPLSEFSEAFLRSCGLLALVAYAKGEIDDETFRRRALAEQQRRCSEAEEKRALQARAAELAAAEWEAERLRAERDPRNIAKRKNRELREKFGLHTYVDGDDFPRLMTILKSLDNAQRLPEESAAWLAAAGRVYRTREIMRAYHRLEADHYLGEFKERGNVWAAVSASSHLRKCEASQEAHDLLAQVPDGRLKSAKLKSAVFTTHGGALRDLGRYDEARYLGEHAHALVEANYMPCTLLGAIHIELGQIAEGHAWYAKAEVRGAPRDDIDRDVRAILLRLPAAKRVSIVEELITHYPHRYEWLRKSFRT
ncbi:MAG TPA: hypothetical protein VLC71_05490 [Thermomonas sp.]|nr:hypothetical protein [Thermomonas sp.]